MVQSSDYSPTSPKSVPSPVPYSPLPCQSPSENSDSDMGQKFLEKNMLKVKEEQEEIKKEL
jgi:hypothetical protein